MLVLSSARKSIEVTVRKTQNSMGKKV